MLSIIFFFHVNLCMFCLFEVKFRKAIPKLKNFSVILIRIWPRHRYRINIVNRHFYVTKVNKMGNEFYALSTNLSFSKLKDTFYADYFAYLN